MARLTPERREQKFASMRTRQQWLNEAREAKEAGLPPPTKPRVTSEPKPVQEIPQMHRVKYVAEQLGVSRQTVTQWFWDRGVKIPSKGGPQRRKVTLLIPHEVFEDWKREHT